MLDEYDKAVGDANNRRNIKPAIYNAKRLAEEPIPAICAAALGDVTDINVDKPAEEVDGPAEEVDERAEEQASSIAPSELELPTIYPLLLSEIDANDIDQANPSEIDELEREQSIDIALDELELPSMDPLQLSEAEIDVKLETDSNMVHYTNIEAIEQLLTSEEIEPLLVEGDGDDAIVENVPSIVQDIIDNDIVFLVGPEGFPKPIVINVDRTTTLVKREKDQITGNIPFNEGVSNICIFHTSSNFQLILAVDANVS